MNNTPMKALILSLFVATIVCGAFAPTASAQYYYYPTYTYPTYSYPTYNYPYYNNQYNHYYQPVSVYCGANVNSSYPGQFVTWTAYASGGNGYYTYDWEGENVSYNNSSSISVPYYVPGTKAPTVTVSSGNHHIRQSCTSVTVISPSSYHQNNWWMPW